MGPLVTVLMSVYNGETYLKEAIDSILSQTYRNFEFIIIDDGSKDKSLDIIKSYSDSRIKFYINKKNMGLIYSLNKGLDLAKGKYIARMDADDISFKNRFKLQVEYMEKNEDISVLGGEFYFFKENKILKKKRSVSNNVKKIKAKLFFENTISHPTVIIRSEVLKVNNYKYDENHIGSEDYGLWNLISEKYRISNLKEPLVYYRLLKTSITSKENNNVEGRYKTFKSTHTRQLKRLGIETIEENFRIFFEIQLVSYIENFLYTIEKKEEFLKLIIDKNEKNRIYDLDFFKNECVEKFYKVCLCNGSFIDYKQSEFYKMVKINRISFYKGVVKLFLVNFIKRRVW